MKRLQGARGLNQIAVASAGIGALPDYPAPHQTIEVAWEHGLDVTGHRSRPLSPFLLDWADIVLIMEPYMRNEIQQIWPKKDLGKVLLLGSFAIGDAPVEEIQDPFGGSPDDFNRCFKEIEKSLEGLLKTLISENALAGETF